MDDTKDDNKSVSDEGFKYWLDLVKVFGGGSPVLIFQNEKGGRSKSIDLQGIQARHPNVKVRYAGNLGNPHSADAMRKVSLSSQAARNTSARTSRTTLFSPAL